MDGLLVIRRILVSVEQGIGFLRPEAMIDAGVLLSRTNLGRVGKCSLNHFEVSHGDVD